MRDAPPRALQFLVSGVLLGGLTVSAAGVALVIALLVRHAGGGVGPRSAGAVADLVLVSAFSVLVRPGDRGEKGRDSCDDVGACEAPRGVPAFLNPVRLAILVVVLAAAATLAFA